MSSTPSSDATATVRADIDEAMRLRIAEQLAAGFKSDSIAPDDAERRLVHVSGGCRLGDVDAATAPHGLVVPAGIMSETGVGGLALGGGIGWLSRKHWLTCDQFVSLEVVLASGETIEVSADEHPDRFWASRGGGANFAIVTCFRSRACR